MKRIIIMGSPRSGGRSAHLAEMLFEANIDERPEDELFLVPVSEVEVGPCVACNACREKMEVVLRDAQGNEARELRHRCVFDDDMQALYDLIDDADELTVVSPVFFSGAPSLMKALLDRLQPYYWAMKARKAEDGTGSDEGAEARGESKVRKGAERGGGREGVEGCEGAEGCEGVEGSVSIAKRPAALHVVGEGGDPHGYDALVSEVKSALAVAGFRLERVFDWVGKIDEAGEITADAEETVLVKPEAAEAPETSAVPTGTSVDIGMGEKPGKGALRAPAEQGAHLGSQSPPTGKTPHPAKPRPKLDLGAAGKQPPKRNKGKAKRRG